MLVFTIHAGIYTSCWYLHFMLVFTIHAGIYEALCWYLRFMLVFTVYAGNYGGPEVHKRVFRNPVLSF